MLTEGVHGVGVAVLGGNHQRRPAMLINSLHIGVVRAVLTINAYYPLKGFARMMGSIKSRR